MALDLADSRQALAELREHRGHNIECVSYGGRDDNVALECADCSVVLLDFGVVGEASLLHLGES